MTGARWRRRIIPKEYFPNGNFFGFKLFYTFTLLLEKYLGGNVESSVTRFGEISTFWLKFLIVFGNFSKVF